jgi:hypothetical protein
MTGLSPCDGNGAACIAWLSGAPLDFMVGKIPQDLVCDTSIMMRATLVERSTSLRQTASVRAAFHELRSDFPTNARIERQKGPRHVRIELDACLALHFTGGPLGRQSGAVPSLSG